MSELHKSSYEAQEFEPNEGQRGLLCSNKASLRCPSLSSSSKDLSSDTIQAIEKLSMVLKPIYMRMKNNEK